MNDEIELAPHVSEIKRTLSNVDESSILKELGMLVLEYGIPLGEAKLSIIRKHKESALEIDGLRRIADLRSGDHDVSVKGKITFAAMRLIMIRGEEKKLCSGFMADDSSEVPFTAFCEFDASAGDSISAYGAHVRLWMGEPELVFSESASIHKLEGDLFPSVKVKPRDLTKELREFCSGDRSVNLICKIISLSEDAVERRGVSGTIFKGVVADRTAKLPMTVWSDSFEFCPGDVIQIDNAYVHEWHGMPTINVGEYSDVSLVDDPSVLPGGSVVKLEYMSIGDVERRGSAFDVLVDGDLTSIKKGSGLIKRCPECGRVMRRGTCKLHGSVSGSNDLRVKAVVDDGTGALNLVIGSELTKYICGDVLNDLDLDNDAVEERIRSRLMGMPVRVRGNVSRADFGNIMVASDIQTMKKGAE